MDPYKYLPYIVGAICLYLIFLSFFIFKTINHYRRLTRGTTKQNLGLLLENVVSKLDLSQEQVKQVAEEVTKLENLNKRNFQKHALARFNPFEDTGGDQSFAIAVLDGENNGIVISSLHSRQGTRVYAKEVVKGDYSTHQFSKEEKEVVEKAASNAARAARPVKIAA